MGLRDVKGACHAGAREIADDALDGPVLEGADTPEKLLERLGFPRRRQEQLVGGPTSPSGQHPWVMNSLLTACSQAPVCELRGQVHAFQPCCGHCL